jgi:hypothetical protein
LSKLIKDWTLWIWAAKFVILIIVWRLSHLVDLPLGFRFRSTKIILTLRQIFYFLYMLLFSKTTVKKVVLENNNECQDRLQILQNPS